MSVPTLVNLAKKQLTIKWIRGNTVRNRSPSGEDVFSWNTLQNYSRTKKFFEVSCVMFSEDITHANVNRQILDNWLLLLKTHNFSKLERIYMLNTVLKFYKVCQTFEKEYFGKIGQTTSFTGKKESLYFHFFLSILQFLHQCEDLVDHSADRIGIFLKDVTKYDRFEIDGHLELLHKCFFKMSLDGLKKFGGDDEFLRRFTWEIDDDVQISKIQMLNLLTDHVKECRPFFEYSRCLERLCVSEKFVKDPRASDIKFWEFLRNAAIQVEAPKALYQWSRQWTDLGVDDRRNHRGNKYGRQDIVTGKYLFCERTYLQIAILTAMLLNPNVDIPMSNRIKDLYNNIIKEICVSLPETITPNVVKFQGLRDFVVKQCFQSNLAGPICFGILTIQLLLVNDPGFRDTFKGGQLERFILNFYNGNRNGIYVYIMSNKTLCWLQHNRIIHE